MKTLITGATGFIGSHLLERLIKTRDKNEIYCLARHQSSCNNLRNRGVNVIKGSLEDKLALAGIFRDLNIEIVYHVAATARINRPASEYLINNIIGTRNIMECLQGYPSNLKKVIYMSSIHASSHHTSSYGKSKRIGEEIVIQVCQKIGVPYCILRPSIVYGPENKMEAGLMKFVAVIKKKKLFSRLNFPGVCSLIYVHDLVRFCLLVEKNEKANNKIFHIYSDQRVSIDEIMDKISAILGISRRRIKLPFLLYRTSSSFLPLLSKCFSIGGNLADSLSLLLNDSWSCRASSAEELLGFRPDYRLDRGLKETMDWLQKIK